MHPAALPIDALLAACEVRRSRAAGPGGQHRNKVETAIHLTHRPTGVAAQASERRSQEANRKAAVFRLRVNLALAVRSDKAETGSSKTGESKAANPSALWRSRVRGGRLSLNAGHDDYPAMLAEALDVLAWQDHDIPAAAAWLGVSMSQLLKLLRAEPRALQQVNAARRAAGAATLR